MITKILNALAIILVLFLIACIIIGLSSCNPIKQVREQVKKDAKMKGELAKVCAEQFPPTSASEVFIAGNVDTAALLNWFNNRIQSVVVHDTQYVRSFQEVLKHDTINIVKELKRFIKPDTILISTGIDSAMYEALKYRYTEKSDSLASYQNKLAVMQVKYAQANGTSKTRLWMLIALLAFNAGAVVLLFKWKGISSAFKFGS